MSVDMPDENVWSSNVVTVRLADHAEIVPATSDGLLVDTGTDTAGILTVLLLAVLVGWLVVGPLLP